MKFKIHFTKNNTENYIIVEGDTLESIREQANALVEKVKPEYYWSEEIA